MIKKYPPSLGLDIRIFYIILGLLIHCLFVDNTMAQNPNGGHTRDSIEIVRLKNNFDYHLKEKHSKEARLTIDTLRSYAQKAGLNKILGDCYFDYALIEKSNGNIQGYIDNLKTSTTYYMLDEAWKAASISFTGIAQVYVEQQNYPEAIDNFSESLRLREKIKDSLGMTNNLLNIGGMNYKMGNYAEANDFFYSALRISDKTGNINLTASILSNLSLIQNKLNNYDKSIEYLNRALDIHKTKGNRKGQSNVMNNLGIANFEKGDLRTAKKYFEQSMSIKRELNNDDPGLMGIYNNLGVIAKREGDSAKAIEYYKTALDLAIKLGDKEGEATALNNIGSYNQENSKKAVSPDILLESLDKSKKLGIRKLMLINYDNLCEFYSQHDNYKEAFKYAQLYIALNDSVFKAENSEKIIELQTKYDTELKEKENQILREKARILHLNNLILIISLIAIALLAVFFIILFALKRKSLRQSRLLREKEFEIYKLEIEKSEKESRHLQEVLFAEEQITSLQREQLEEKSRELSTSTIHIINKNEILSDIRKIIEKLITGGASDNKELLKKLLKQIDSNINLDEQWEQFKLHFESVHTGFFTRLMDKFPLLTQNELKLCAYLRMNLSSKEIAQMLNISIESATTKRYRLRKKLLLENEENLINYLSDF